MQITVQGVEVLLGLKTGNMVLGTKRMKEKTHCAECVQESGKLKPKCRD